VATNADPWFTLQLAPTLTVTSEMRHSVVQPFVDRGIAFEWLQMPGDPTSADATRFGDTEIAPPSLAVVVSTESESEPTELIESVSETITATLTHARRNVPGLPISIRSRTPAGGCWFAFKPSASPKSIADAIRCVRDADTGSGVVGWDDELSEWVRL
jgi:hypothetical protein